MRQVTERNADELFEMANLFPRTTGLAMKVCGGHLSPDDRPAVFEWVSLNAAPLIGYWEGRIDTIELGQLLKRIP